MNTKTFYQLFSNNKTLIKNMITVPTKDYQSIENGILFRNKLFLPIDSETLLYL